MQESKDTSAKWVWLHMKYGPVLIVLTLYEIYCLRVNLRYVKQIWIGVEMIDVFEQNEESNQKLKQKLKKHC